ncbi:MAG: VOC family protein [Burkholderiales bacterium]|nr:VOC family protein [Burkholderiales bacterium]
MLASRVTQLGYLGIEVSDVPEWERFATDLLGLASNGADPDGTLYLRMDENHHRFALHHGERDDLAYAGWEAPDEASLRAIAARLESQGVAVRWASAAEARQRRVVGLVKLCDPSGVATELYCGPLVEAERPFRSPRALGGFEAGGLGLGHIVLSVDDYEASLRFYRDGLGLLLSDYLDLEMGPAESTRVAFFHCGPRHHSIAIAQFPAAKRLHHFMLQVREMDDVGNTYDLCQDRRVPIASTLGRHTMDHTLSFYMQTPSGFQVEYGHGGREIDDDVWQVQLHRSPSVWGHRPPEAAATAATTA